MQAMSAVLVHRKGSLQGQKDKVHHDVIRLGRKPDNHVIYSENVVSGYHAEIRRCLATATESSWGKTVPSSNSEQTRERRVLASSRFPGRGRTGGVRFRFSVARGRWGADRTMTSLWAGSTSPWCPPTTRRFVFTPAAASWKTSTAEMEPS